MIDETKLLGELKAAFPGLHVRPLKDLGVPAFTHGAWVGGDAVMPDDLPIFSTLVCEDSPEYDGRVHTAFSAWLEARGWYLECWDHGVYMAIPVALAEEAA